jgi:hypothetical protein
MVDKILIIFCRFIFYLVLKASLIFWISMGSLSAAGIRSRDRNLLMSLALMGLNRIAKLRFSSAAGAKLELWRGIFEPAPAADAARSLLE